MDDKERQRNKWRSRKWIVCVWAMALCVLCVVGAVFIKCPELLTLANILAIIPATYIGCNVAQKRKLEGKE